MFSNEIQAIYNFLTDNFIPIKIVSNRIKPLNRNKIFAKNSTRIDLTQKLSKGYY